MTRDQAKLLGSITHYVFTIIGGIFIAYLTYNLNKRDAFKKDIYEKIEQKASKKYVDDKVESSSKTVNVQLIDIKASILKVARSIFATVA